MVAQILEVLMVVSFGLSWPLSIRKSYRSKTTSGKSLFFLFCILFGYACGIASKLTASNLNYVIIFYIINFAFVSLDILIYLRNLKLDRARV